MEIIQALGSELPLTLTVITLIWIMPKILDKLFVFLKEKREFYNNNKDKNMDRNNGDMRLVTEKIVTALDGITKQLDKISSVLDRTVEKQSSIEYKLDSAKIIIEDLKQQIRNMDKS